MIGVGDNFRATLGVQEGLTSCIHESCKNLVWQRALASVVQKSRAREIEVPGFRESVPVVAN